MDEAFPYRALDARPGGAGVGIYSRYPLADVSRIAGYELAMVQARIRVDGVAKDTTVMSVHLAAPWPQPIDGWHRDYGRFARTLADLAAKSEGGAILIGGDFNSTIDMRPYRELLTNGYRDAAEQAGAGRELTYPANRRIPPVHGSGPLPDPREHRRVVANGADRGHRPPRRAHHRHAAARVAPPDTNHPRHDVCTGAAALVRDARRPVPRRSCA